MKILIKIVGGIFVVLVLLFVALELALDKIILKGFNAAAPAALGVPATLQGANLSLLRGKASLQGLHIGNPAGYKTDGLLDLGSVTVRLDNSSLLSDTIVIREIAVDGLVVTYEKGLLNSNLGALIDALATPEEPGADKPKDEKPASEKPGKKVVIEKLTIAGSKMNFSVSGAAALTGGGAIPILLPPITLTDLGREKEGLTVAETIQRVLSAIAGATGTAIAGSGKLIGQGIGAVGEGAMAVGEGAVDAGRAVADGVGNALNAVNPFKK